MPEIGISDASTLILFGKIEEFNLLQKVYGTLIATPEVALPVWIRIQSVSDKKYQNFLKTQVDAGETSAMTLAAEFDDVLLLLDDLKARKLTVRLKFKIRGTLGVVYKAKKMPTINKVKHLLDKLMLTHFSESI